MKPIAIMRRRMAGAAAPAPPSHLAVLKASPAVRAVYDVSDFATMFQNIDGPANAAPTPVASAADAVGYVRNLKAGAAGAYDLAANSLGLRPIATKGLTYPAGTHRLDTLFPGGAIPGASNSTLIGILKTAETNGGWVWSAVVSGGSSSRVQSAATTGAFGTSGAGYSGFTLALDGAAVAANAVAINDNLPHVLEASGNISQSGSTTLSWGGGASSGQCVEGIFIPVAILDAGHANYSAALTAARGFAAQLVAGLQV